MSVKIISSPLQGFTDFRFRNAHHHYFGGVDTYYAPYIRLNGKLEIKKSYQKDLDPKNNEVDVLIPQVMTNSPEEFLFVIDYVKSLGYDELNWNLGCPYPMVTKRGMGSGLICEPAKIDEVLSAAFNERDIKVSMKMRMGYENATEILEVFPILDKYPIENVAIHARIGKQLYKGGVDLESFSNCLDKGKHEIFYNGDVTSVSSFRAIKDRFPSIETFLIGRGLISDPFLSSMIKNDNEEYPENRRDLFSNYHDMLLQMYQEQLSGEKHLLMKMYQLWEYFHQVLDLDKKDFKKLKKVKKLGEYEQIVSSILNNYL